MEIVEYPLWRIAVGKVLEFFEVNGYGGKITHKQIKEWMAIPEPTTIDQAKKADLDYLSGVDKMRMELLEDSNLFLYPVIGMGYEILHPKDQIRKGANKYIRQSQNKLRRSTQVLANVDLDQLDQDSRMLLMEKINRLAFLKSSFRKRTIPNYTQKQIS